MGEPGAVVPGLEVVAVVGAAALFAGEGAGHDRLGAVEHAAEFVRFEEFGIEGGALVVDGDVGVLLAELVDDFHCPLEALAGADDRDVVHHHLLHRLADVGDSLAFRPAEQVGDFGAGVELGLGWQRGPSPIA